MPGIGVQVNVFVACHKSFVAANYALMKLGILLLLIISEASGDHNEWLKNTQEMSYHVSCILVSNIEFPKDLCGPHCDSTSSNPDENVSLEAVLKVKGNLDCAIFKH